MKRSSALVAFALVLALQGLPGSAVRAGGTAAPAGNPQLNVCLTEDSAPFSASRPQPSGIDFDIAGELAGRLGRPLGVSWIQIPNRGGLEKALRGAFQDDRCALFFGLPSSAAPVAGLGERGLRASAPYRSAGYVLVTARSSKVRSLDEARRARRVGAVTATPADLFLFAQGFPRVPYPGNEALLAALSADAVDAAVMWMPALVRLAGEGRTLWPEAVREGEIADPSLRTEFVIVMQAHGEEAARIDEALRQMGADGALAEISRRHGLPRRD